MAPSRPFVVSPVLTSIAIGYRNPDVAFIADQAMPRVDVGGETFKWTEYPLAEAFTVPDTRVGRKGRVPEVEFSGTEKDGSVQTYGLQDPIPNSDIEAAKAQRNRGLSSYDPLNHSTLMLTHLMHIDREKRVAAAVQNPANYAAANVTNITTAGDRFDDPDSDPEAVFDAALDDAMIYRPNTATMSEAVWNVLRKHQKLVKSIKGTTTGAGKITREEFTSYFELRRLLIGAGYINAAKKGQAENIQRIWGKHISLTYLDSTAGSTGGVTWGFSPVFGTRVAGTIEDSNIGLHGGVVLRVGETINELVVAKAAGALIQNAIS